MDDDLSKIDAELASIVSSLSALSHQSQPLQPNRTLGGGYRRGSFNSNHDSESDFLNASSPAFRRTALSSIGDAHNNASRLLGHYPASIAVPMNHKVNTAGGFFERFGRNLVESTREIELGSAISGQSSETLIHETDSEDRPSIWNPASAPVFTPSASYSYPFASQPFVPAMPLGSPPAMPDLLQPHLEDGSQGQLMFGNPYMFFNPAASPAISPPPGFTAPPMEIPEPHDLRVDPSTSIGPPMVGPGYTKGNLPTASTPSGAPSVHNTFQSSTAHGSTPGAAATNMTQNKGKKTKSRRGKNANHIYRSPMLEDFRANPQRFRLKDIFGYAHEFSQDQHGSRFIQQELVHASDSEKEMIFNEVRDFTLELCTDVFGNYVVQKFFEHGTIVQKDVLFKTLRGSVESLSMQMYGCRVIQRALEHVMLEQKIALVGELKNCILACIKDQNGNHVIQKSIEMIPLQEIPYIADSLRGQVYHLSTHPYGCRVIQRLLEFGSDNDRQMILTELNEFWPFLIQDQYGNYVIQHILENNKSVTKDKIVGMITDNVVEYSKHKFASNVVERSLMYGSSEQQQALMGKILPGDVEQAKLLEDASPLASMMKDQFGNYVVQKLVEIANGEQKKILVVSIRSYLTKISSAKTVMGRHLASVEKLAALVENVEI